MSRCLKLAFFLTIGILLLPASGLAEIGRWIPSIVDYDGELDVYGIYRTYETKTNALSLDQTQKWLWMRENLNLRFTGFVYHPRLVEYEIGLNLGLVQDKYETDGLSRSRSGWLNGINARATVLPMHPYNLELFWLRYEPLSGGGFSSNSVVTHSKGAIFRYKQKPYFLTASYIDSTRESNFDTSDWISYLLNFAYFKQYDQYKTLTFSATAQRTEFSSSSSPTKSIGNSVALTNTISLRKFSLSSALRYFNGDFGSASSNSFSWNENLAYELPLNFRTSLFYLFSKSDTEQFFANGGNTTSQSNGAGFSITNQLYQSLSSGYSLGYLKTDSSEGSAQSLSNSFNVSYAKNIPGGIVRSSVNLARTDYNIDGATATIDTPFRQAVPKNINEPPFRLNAANVDASSITVFLLDPDVHDHRILLEQGIHYTVTPFGIGFEIEIISLPPEFPLFTVYDFLVSYKSNAHSEYEQDTFNFRLSLDLFNTFYPYYSHDVTKQRVVSGFVQGGNYDTVSNAVGIQVNYAPFTFSAGYAHTESDIVPSTTWSLEADYRQNLTETALLIGRVQFTNTDYPRGTSGNGIAYTEQKIGGNVGITKRFPLQGVYLNASGSYWNITSLTDSNSYSGNASVSWKVFRAVLELGASINFTDSKAAGLKTERNYRNYYLRLRRRIL